MRSKLTLAAAFAAILVAGCGESAEVTQTGDAEDGTQAMEGGGVYPVPQASLAVEPLATDPATAATQNEVHNMAPSSLRGARPPQGQPSNPVSPPPGATGRQ